MVFSNKHHRAGVGVAGGRARADAFTLIELMTVVFIIGLLIGILVPSLTAARNYAKKTSTGSTIKVLSGALEAFRNDHAKDYRQTNGYAPSFAHPPILDAGGAPTFQPYRGEFPFRPALGGGAVLTPSVVYGAHWLPAMLIGVDALGVVTRSGVPKGLRGEPQTWYAADPLNNGSGPLSRSPLYVDPTGLKTVATEDLAGSRNEANSDFFPDWASMRKMPVIVDAFDQPILYYVSSTYGSTANPVEDDRNANSAYFPGPPYYFHQDNEGFTGTGIADTERGWDFGGGEHTIARSGEELDGSDIDEPENRESFARYILDDRAFSAIANPIANSPLKPVNPDTFLLMSAGRDARYGTVDDVTNFPLATD